MSFTVAQQLANDCYFMGRNQSVHVLLNKNALYPWFVLVPESETTEFYLLTDAQQTELLRLINRLSRFIKAQFNVDKLNIATIGNVVSQLHIHVIGRSHADPCWPGVVWGNKQFSDYSPEAVAKIRSALGQEELCQISQSQEKSCQS